MTADRHVRCICCSTPVQRPWMRYCRSCYAWRQFAAALHLIRVSRPDRGVRR